jgi:hypothetical protein
MAEMTRNLGMAPYPDRSMKLTRAAFALALILAFCTPSRPLFAQQTGPAMPQSVSVQIKDVSPHSWPERNAWVIAVFTTLVAVTTTAFVTILTTGRQVIAQTRNLEKQLVENRENLKTQLQHLETERKNARLDEEKRRRTALAMALGFTGLLLEYRSDKWAQDAQDLIQRDIITRDDILRMRIAPEQSLEIDWQDAALLNQPDVYARFSLIRNYVARVNRRIDNLLRWFPEDRNEIQNHTQIRALLAELSTMLREVRRFCASANRLFEQQFEEAKEFIKNCRQLLADIPQRDLVSRVIKRGVNVSSTTPKYNEETIRFRDGQLATKITGPNRAQYDFDIAEWINNREEGAVATASGNVYYVFARGDRIFAVNTRASEVSRGYTGLPALQFGAQWKIPDFYDTSAVTELVLKYSVAGTGDAAAVRLDAPNPFDEYAHYQAMVTESAG